MAPPLPNYLLLSLPSFNHLILSEYPPTSGTVQGARDMGYVRHHPFFQMGLGLKEVMDVKMIQQSLMSVQVYGVTTQSSPGGENEAFVKAKLALSLGR